MNSEKLSRIAAFAFVLPLLLLLSLPFSLGIDGQVRFESLEKLWTHGVLDSARYSVIGPLFSSPLYWIGNLLGKAAIFCAAYNWCLLAIFCFYFYFRGAAKLKLPHAVSAGFLFLLAWASMYAHHVQFYYGEVFSSLLVFIGLLYLVENNSRRALVCLTLAVMNQPPLLAGIAVLCTYQYWQKRDWKILGPIATAGLAILIENYLVRGNVFNTGYGTDGSVKTVMPFSAYPGFSYPLVYGLLSQIFSFGKGLIFFAPGLLLLLSHSVREVLKQNPRAFQMIQYALVFLAGVLIIYGQWWAWYAGIFWGPRFLLFASLPATLVIATLLHHTDPLPLRLRVAALAALAASLWVGFSGMAYGLTDAQICFENGFALEHLCWYTPEFSPLFRPLLFPKPYSLMEKFYYAVSMAILFFYAQRAFRPLRK